MKVTSLIKDGVCTINFSNPPVNAISVGSGLVDELRQALESAIAESDAKAIVLIGADARFSAGADINDFEQDPKRLDLLRALLNAVEDSPKPIVAAIASHCLGGGLELALACHYRVASPDARFGFPEVTLGLLPGAGGTQRTPRLIGAKNALDLMLSGKLIDTPRALEIGLVDEVAKDGDILSAAATLAEQKGQQNQPRKTGALPPPGDLAEAIEAKRAQKSLSVAGQNIIACVKAAGDNLSDGLALEAQLFSKLMVSQQSRALRHGFFGRRIVSRIPNAPKTTPQPIDAVTVIGGGLMGTGIAIALLNAGLKTALVEPREDGRKKAEGAIVSALQRDVAKGRLAQSVADERLNGLSVVGQLEEASGADLFVEAVFEDMDVKKQVFEALDAVASADAILASNTSTLDLNAIAAFTKRPESVVGLHFFSPANIMRLLEIVRGKHTSHETLASAMAFAKKIRKTGVVAGVCDGFIGNRIFEEYLRQAWFLLEEGALPQQIDKAMESFGMAMGPCRVMDLAGQDIGWSIRKRRAIEQPDRPYSKIPDLVCELGRFGQKTGAGFYQYSDGRTPEIDPEIDALIVAESDRLGIERRSIDDEEIIERCIFAMTNEGARILEEEIAFRPIDIDIVYLDGYGFPADKGGPMFYADQCGLANVLASVEKFAARRQGWAWTPSPLLVKLATQGAAFAELNER